MSRPTFPKRAVVTAGMPYGDKDLHFGHVGAVFIPADVTARFLRDRIGADNVLFMSGTDCYGAGIEAAFAKASAVDASADASIEDYVRRHHDNQKAVLDAYQISLDLFAASALDEAGAVHKEVSKEAFEALYAGGYLTLEETMQFYDSEAGVFLNGRQVTGRCPIQGCKAETAYADECALGHQYDPAQLIAPKSALSGKTPDMRPVKNWYFDLPRFRARISAYVDAMSGQPDCRPNALRIMREFLKDPTVYIKKEDMDAVHALPLPEHTVQSEEGKPSDALVFADLETRDAACKALTAAGIRYRTGKALVPFRLSGNVAWGVPVPDKDGAAGLTFWVWPESLWAPLSFTKTLVGERWRDFWRDPDAKVYQFLGEDNVYFYGLAEAGLFWALGFETLPILVTSQHLLYGDKKASSSGAVKPPMAADLLDHYTPEQLRMHFAAMSLGLRSVGFKPGAFLGSEGFDEVLTEGNLLTNIFNRLIRSCFYTYQQHGMMADSVSEATVAASRAVIEDVEDAFYRFEFGRAVEALNIYLRSANKRFAAESKGDNIAQLLADAFHMVRVAATLLHPFAPIGCDKVREYLGVDERLWDWTYIFEGLAFFEPQLKFLEPQVDFFEKHKSQLNIQLNN